MENWEIGRRRGIGSIGRIGRPNFPRNFPFKSPLNWPLNASVNSPLVYLYIYYKQIYEKQTSDLYLKAICKKMVIGHWVSHELNELHQLNKLNELNERKGQNKHIEHIGHNERNERNERYEHEYNELLPVTIKQRCKIISGCYVIIAK